MNLGMKVVTSCLRSRDAFNFYENVDAKGLSPILNGCWNASRSITLQM